MNHNLASKSEPKFLNYSKFNDFFDAKDNKKDYMFEDDAPSMFKPVIIKNQRSNSVLNNIEMLQEKSSLRGKIETYLLDNRKMGVLD